MGSSEVSMKEGDKVVLKKLGCAGWWYVKVLGKDQISIYSLFPLTTLFLNEVKNKSF